MEFQPREASQTKFEVYVGSTKINAVTVYFRDGNISISRKMIGNFFAEVFKGGRKVTVTLVPCYYVAEMDKFLDMEKIQFVCDPIDYWTSFTTEINQDGPVDERLVFKILKETGDGAGGS